jgi:hypothetical protein
MAVSLKLGTDSVEPSGPRELFLLPAVDNGYSPYEATPDGQRFLVRAVPQQTSSRAADGDRQLTRADEERTNIALRDGPQIGSGRRRMVPGHLDTPITPASKSDFYRHLTGGTMFHWPY